MSKSVLSLFLFVCIAYAVALPFGKHNAKRSGNLIKGKRTSPVQPVIEPVITVNTGEHGTTGQQECSDLYGCHDVDPNHCDEWDEYICPRTCGLCVEEEVPTVEPAVIVPVTAANTGEHGAPGGEEEKCEDNSGYCGIIFFCDTSDDKKKCRKFCGECNV